MTKIFSIGFSQCYALNDGWIAKEHGGSSYNFKTVYVLNHQGEIEQSFLGGHTGYNIYYEKENKSFIVANVFISQVIFWRSDPIIDSPNINCCLENINFTSSKKQFLTLPIGITENNNYKETDVLICNIETGQSKVMVMPFPVTISCLSTDCLTLLISGKENYLIIDNPLIS